MLLLLATASYAQTKKVLVIGFPEKNFFSEWKPKDKLAKKNSVPTNQVDDLYRIHLLLAIRETKEGIEFIVPSGNQEELFANSEYSTMQNASGKEYLGVVNALDKEKITKLLDEYQADYVVHLSQYRMSLALAVNLHTMIVHRFDYVLMNRSFDILSGDMYEFSGIMQGAFRPAGVKNKYAKKASNMSKEILELIAN